MIARMMRMVHSMVYPSGSVRRAAIAGRLRCQTGTPIAGVHATGGANHR